MSLQLKMQMTLVPFILTLILKTTHVVYLKLAFMDWLFYNLIILMKLAKSDT